MRDCVAPAPSSGVARRARNENENVSCDRECQERSLRSHASLRDAGRTKASAPTQDAEKR